MRFTYCTEQWLAQPLDAVFAFFADPENLPRLMPQWQKPRIESANIIPPPGAPSTSAKAAGTGSKIVLSFLPFPLTPFRLKWQAEIVDFEWNSHFCDLQVRGPFKYWKHCHRLRSVEREGVNVTVITDQLEYELPFESLGVLGHRFLVRKQIERIFEYRHQQVFRIFTDRSNLHIPAA
jgi:ligand-binding SRPBCC domain-containing protein